METTDKVTFYESRGYAILDEYGNAHLIGDMYECTRFISLCKKYDIASCRKFRIVKLKSPTILTIQ